MPSSFRKDLPATLAGYRTPSPPRDAFEPLSPITAKESTTCTLDLSHAHNFGNCDGLYKLSSLQGEHNDVVGGNARINGGTMDAFVSIALATTSHNTDRTSVTTHSDCSDEYHGRPSKRARSEVLPLSNWSKKRKGADTRPATSHNHSPEHRRLEAELLINFAQAAAQLTSPSPVISQAHLAQISSEGPDTIGHASPKTKGSGRETGSCIPLHLNIRPNEQHSALKTLTTEFTATVSPITTDTTYNSPGLGKVSQARQTIVSPETSRYSDLGLKHSKDDAMGLISHAVQLEQDAAPERKDALGVLEDQMVSETLKSSMNSKLQDELGLAKLRLAENEPGAQSLAVTPLVDILSIMNHEPRAGENGDERSGWSSEDAVAHEIKQIPEEERGKQPRSINGSLQNNEIQGSESLGKTADYISGSSLEYPSLQYEDSGVSIADDQSQSMMASATCSACHFMRNSKAIEIENDSTSWISCDVCKDWFHFACAGFKNEREVRSVDRFRCRRCKPIHGSTTYVRKSSRAHSAIDYAGLHQGVIKTSDDRPEHHYIKPIKEGTITFLPENFARMRPELVTAEYFEKGTGMKEPIIIPATSNPQRSCSGTGTVHNQNDDNDESTQLANLDEEGAAETWFSRHPESDNVLDYGQDALDMVVPQGLSVRQVAELYGPEEKVEVIDVKSQNGENKKWTMGRWADYYENPNNKVVRNVISLEVSQSRLGRLIKRPQIVRDLDLQDSVWPKDLLAKGEYPRVQFYCLMSVADCFTDFHIDFGGSSVFYHIIKGKKTFLFIPPKEKHLKKYEEWCMSPAQNWTFLGDQTKECYRVDLSQGDTMLIPSGWIHAVWTPEDSLVIGGNFLTRMNFGMQLRIAQVEKATGVARKFRYPHFQKLHWYTALQYLERDPLPESVRNVLYAGGTFPRETPAHDEFNSWGENSRPGLENYHARYYSQPELDGLPDLTRYLLRTALIDGDYISEGIPADTRNAVKKSIPRGHGEPLDIIKSFATWCAWKRGNESIPHWAYPDAVPENLAPDKLSAAAMRKLDREAALSAPRRQSARKSQQQFSETAPPDILVSSSFSNTLPAHEVERATTNMEQPDPAYRDSHDRPRTVLASRTNSHRKTACESCRRRRRACKHKDQVARSMAATGTNHTRAHVTGVQADVDAPHSTSHITSDAILRQPTSKGFDEMPITNQTAVLGVEQAFGLLQNRYHVHIHHPKKAVQSSLSLQEIFPEVPEHNLAVSEDASKGHEHLPGNVLQPRPRHKACNDCRKSKVSMSLLHVPAV